MRHLVAYQHAISFMIHLCLYCLLYPFWKKISLLSVGFFILAQLFGFDLILLALRKDNMSWLFQGVGLILMPFFLDRVSKTSILIGKKKYSGIRNYLLLIDTDLKYVMGFFTLSLLLNLYLAPILGTTHYANLSSVGAFLLSIPFCKRMRVLKGAP